MDLTYIITTNYDTLIEDEIKKLVQTGLSDIEEMVKYI